MPLHPPHAEQARCSSSIALIGDGAPSRGWRALKPATALRMFTPHRATSSCVGLLVARIDARAKRTAGASDRSAGNGRTVAEASGMSQTRRGDSAINGRASVKGWRDAIALDAEACSDAFARAHILSASKSTVPPMALPFCGSHEDNRHLGCQDIRVERSSEINDCATRMADERSGSGASRSASIASSTIPSRLKAKALSLSSSLSSSRADMNQVSRCSALVGESGKACVFMAPLIGGRHVESYRPDVSINGERQPTVENGRFVALQPTRSGV